MNVLLVAVPTVMVGLSVLGLVWVVLNLERRVQLLEHEKEREES